MRSHCVLTDETGTLFNVYKYEFPSKETIAQEKSNTRLLKGLYLRQVLPLLM